MIKQSFAIAALWCGLTAGAMSPERFGEIVNRLEALPVQQADSVAAALLTDSDALTDLEQTARDLIYNPERPDEINERVYASIARAIAESPLASNTQRALAEWEAHAAEMNAPGCPAADFTVRQLSGADTSMIALTAGKAAMLYFYNPDCRHCLQVLNQLREATMPAPVYAICVDSTEKRWRDTVGQLPDGWTPLLDVTDVQAEDLYIFLATPSIYLLDADGRVTAKNPSTKSLTDK